MQLSEIRINLCGPASPPGPSPAGNHRFNSDDRGANGHDHRHDDHRGDGHRNGAHRGDAAHNGVHRGDAARNDAPRGGRLRAYCSLTFDRTFVVRDVKLIEGNDGLFVAMPSRKLCDRCRRCGEKNHLRARFCNQCGSHLDENRHARGNGENRGGTRLKLHADIAHPINAAARLEIERRVVMAFLEEQDRSRDPDYVPPNLDADLDGEVDHFAHAPPADYRLRPTGTESR